MEILWFNIFVLFGYIFSGIYGSLAFLENIWLNVFYCECFTRYVLFSLAIGLKMYNNTGGSALSLTENRNLSKIKETSYFFFVLYFRYNGGCSHICTVGPDNQPECKCPTDDGNQYFLANGDKECIVDVS